MTTLLSFHMMFLSCSSDFNSGDVAEWRFDPSQVGGGVVMDGAIHWMRPLRLL